MEAGSKQDGEVVNMTRAMEALSPWLNHPRRTIIRVEALVLTTSVLLSLQLILGSCKRRWHYPCLKGGLSLCNTAMFPLVLYTLSTMQSSPIKNSLYPIWSVFLIMASMGTNAVQQYDFHGGFYKKIMQTIVDVVRHFFYGFMLLLLFIPFTLKELISFSSSKRAMPWGSVWVVSLALVILMTKYIKSLSHIFLEYSKRRRLPLVAETERVGECANDHHPSSDSMKGYNYIVLESNSGKHITIDQIWDCCGNSKDGKALRDICLSYALFRQLLARRYFGVFRPEDSLLKANDFETLFPSEEHYVRAFGIIEVELGFCYDFFFTRYQSTFRSMELPGIRIILVFLFLTQIVLMIVVGVFITFRRKSVVLETPDPIIQVHSTRSDYTIACIILGIALTVEVMQAAIYLVSDWSQVSLACMYVKNKYCSAANAFIGKAVIGFLRRFIISGQLRRKIDQYSIVFGQKHYSVEVSDAVKRAIARSLILTRDPLTNGGTSLWRSLLLNPMFEEYHRTLKDHSPLEVMLVWHIATEYCNLSYDAAADGGTTGGDRGVAVDLSRYCAHLIESVPELLPYYAVDIAESKAKVAEGREKLFGVQEKLWGSLKKRFGFPIPRGGYRRSETYNKMKSLERTEDDGDSHATMTVFAKGVRLGKQLERSVPDEARRWKVMADFWAKTIINVAPSHCTAEQHMQHLENGGEFLTHIWALRFHAGVPRPEGASSV
ncbi:hypothetical protein BS78_07G049700 [Paspalum vaginatum]|nr:hypothetical protein BS78_07G049700 [Paspalum vaginatum]